MRQRDKLTTAWLHLLPGSHSSPSSKVFREGLAMVLCLPSPACRDRVGQSIGEAKVDIGVDRVACQKFFGRIMDSSK